MTLQIPLALEQLVRLVATKTGKTPDDIIKEAIEVRALTAGIAVKPARRAFDDARVRAIVAQVAAMPILDHRSDDEIIGYYTFGVPR